MILTLLSFLACAPKGFVTKQLLNPQTQSNFHLRKIYDQDPSDFIGRFVDDEATGVDDSAARTTECSKYITFRVVGAGGVEYDEVYNASSSVMGGLQIPAGFEIKVGASTTLGVRAKYVATNKMVADIRDPVNFDACCRKKKSNCTKRFISEFVEGQGDMWVAIDTYKGIKALDKLKAIIPANIEAAGQYAWAQSRKFPNPVYFAMSVTEVPRYDCWELMDNLPESEDGVYFSGRGKPMKSEVDARKNALYEGNIGVLQYIGRNFGDSNKMSRKVDRILENDSFIRRAVTGIARKVKSDMYCPIRKENTSTGPMYESGVLLFVSHENLKAFEEELFGNITE